MQKATPKFDFSKPLMWDLPECMEQFKALIDNPPLHSVVVHIEPPMMKAILKTANDRNRPLNAGAVWGVQLDLDSGNFEITGDTIKISRKGRLIDGQHRLSSGVKANKGFDTHFVFGLPESVFDVLDRQRTRTAADILAIGGIKNPTTVAGGVRWAKIISEQRRGFSGTGGSKKARAPTPREIRQAVSGAMKDLPIYASDAEAIRKAYGIPPTITCGLLWSIALGNKAVVKSFVEDWLHGNRNYTRNRNFDELLNRIIVIRKQTGGALPRFVLAAMLVQVFNHWNSNTAAGSRALTWKKEWAFPAIVHDAKEFLKRREDHRWKDSSLQTSQLRIMDALISSVDGNGHVRMSVEDISKLANVEPRQVGYLLRTMVANKQIVVDKKGTGGAPHTYRLGELANGVAA